jgi:aryl-alcohol dehydrogenase-like predicted oxidoreductase
LRTLWPMTDLEVRRVGGSGLLVTVLGLGCNNFGRRLDAEGSTRVVQAALDAGVTFFDTADIYSDGSSEEILGAALKGRRTDVVLATKFGGPRGPSPYRRGGSRRWIRMAVEESLRRLNTDWIDLYQMHFPDEQTPIDESLQTLDDLVREGKIRYAGCSQFSPLQMTEAEWSARTRGSVRFSSVQHEYSWVHREAEEAVVPVCARYDIGLIPFYPLAGGLLTGKYQRGQPAPESTRLGRVPALGAQMLKEQNFDIIDGLQRFAREHGCSILDIAIGGLAAQPRVVSVIPGAMSPEQVEANVRAARWRPSPDELEELNRISRLARA